MSMVYNPGLTPVRIDNEGRHLGGHERADVPETAQVKALLKKQLLVKIDSVNEKER